MNGKVKDDYERPIISLRISITNRCNVNCIYCHHDGMLESSSENCKEDWRGKNTFIWWRTISSKRYC